MRQAAEHITLIKKRFRRAEWLLIDVETFDKKTTTPLTGRLIAHSPQRDDVWNLLLKSPQIKRPYILCSRTRLARSFMLSDYNFSDGVRGKYVKRLSLAKKVEKSIVKKGLSLKNLLDDLKTERKRYTLQIVKKSGL
jgi:hypothetical protein